MSDLTPVQTRRKPLALLLGLVAIGGCAPSLAPTAELQTVSLHLAERSAVAAEWEHPWHERYGAWDGHTPLTSDQAVLMALHNNRAIRAEVESIAAARADFAQAHLLPNPVIDFAYGFPTDGLGGSPLMATLMQQMTWLWQRPARIDAADAALQQRVLEVSDAALQLVADARTAHARVVFTERALALEATNTELLRRSLELIEARASVGEATRLDINRLRLDVLQNETTLIRRRADVDRAKRDLLAFIGHSHAPGDWTSDGVVPSVTERLGALDENAAMLLAAGRRLDVAAALAAFEARLRDLDLAKLGGIPDVTIGVSYQRNFMDRPGWFPMIRVTPKLFDNGSVAATRAASIARRAEIEADGVLQSAIAETRVAWVSLDASHDAAERYERDILVLATENASLAEQSLAAGTIDLTVLLEAQRSENDARLRLNDLQRTSVEQVIELERAVGGSLAAPIPGDVATRTGGDGEQPS